MFLEWPDGNWQRNRGGSQTDPTLIMLPVRPCTARVVLFVESVFVLGAVRYTHFH